jgi:serine/threonine protein kinase
VSHSSLPITQLLAEQRQRWARGDCVSVETLLQQHPALGNDTDALLDLIYQEICLREERGETARRNDYLGRFPHLATPLNAQFDVHQVIQSGSAFADQPGPPVVPGYEVLEEVGHGGMGRVYKARDEKAGTLVAVKVLRSEHNRKQAVRKRFLAEGRAAAALDHPHIVKVFAVGECVAGPFLVMELIEGPSLEEVIRRGPPDLARAVSWLIAVADAVHHAHSKGIIHRDLKPANILLDSAGQPRVMDFGMAKVLHRPDRVGLSSTREGVILGTASYMPPEQAGDPEIKAGPYSDIYSLGAILYALLAGRPPFDEGDFMLTVLKVRSSEPPPPVRSLRPEVPELLELICHKCLSKRPADRYSSALELADVLRGIAQALGQAPATAPVVLAGAVGELFPLSEEITVIGRSAECDLVLRAPDVSRRHCRIVRTPGQVTVEDLGSLQGTWVNGSRVARAQLRDGDRLEIARQAFRVQMQPPDR